MTVAWCTPCKLGSANKAARIPALPSKGASQSTRKNNLNLQRLKIKHPNIVRIQRPRISPRKVSNWPTGKLYNLIPHDHNFNHALVVLNRHEVRSSLSTNESLKFRPTFLSLFANVWSISAQNKHLPFHLVKHIAELYLFKQNSFFFIGVMWLRLLSVT